MTRGRPRARPARNSRLTHRSRLKAKTKHVSPVEVTHYGRLHSATGEKAVRPLGNLMSGGLTYFASA